MTPCERLNEMLARSEKAESAKAYVAHMRREAHAIVIGQAISQSAHFYAPSMVAFCDSIDAELQELERARKCLLAVMDRCNETVAEYLPGDGHWSEARRILDIINRELGE